MSLCWRMLPILKYDEVYLFPGDGFYQRTAPLIPRTTPICTLEAIGFSG